jgi:hypothetical protein
MIRVRPPERMVTWRVRSAPVTKRIMSWYGNPAWLEVQCGLYLGDLSELPASSMFGTQSE